MTKTIKTIAIAAAIVIQYCALQIANAQQPTLEWMNVVEGIQPDAMCIDSSGNVFVAGKDDFSPPGFSVAKFNSTGQRLWLRRFIGGGGLSARPVKIGCDQQGNLYVSGYDDTYLLIKYNSAGTQLWYKRFDGTWLTDFEITQTGEPIVTGYVYNGSQTGIDCYTVKCSSEGDTLWTATFNNSESNKNDIANVISQSVNSYIALAGFTQDFNYSANTLTLKYSSSGVIQWVRIFNYINDDGAVDIANDANNIYTLAVINSNGNTEPRFCTITYLPNGDTAWVRIYNYPGNREVGPRKIKADAAGNIIVTGYGTTLPSGGNNIVTVKYNNTGELLWERSYSKPNSILNYNESLALDINNSVYITGTNIRQDSAFQWHYNWVNLKYNSNGSLLWDMEYYGLDSISGGDNILVDKNYNIYINGTGKYNSVRGSIVMKYSQLIGIEPISNEIPNRYRLFQNYPNPFNPVTKIKFSVPKLSNVKLLLYDVLGKEIKTLVNNELKPGIYEIDFNGGNLASGVYFYKLISGDFEETKKMLLIK